MNQTETGGGVVLEAMRIFVKVAECGSFSKAGQALTLSPSAVSRQISRLEAELGAQLFKRSTRHLALTEAGNRLQEEASIWLQQLDHMLGAVRATNPPEPSGELRISAFESFGRLHISPLLPAFLRQYPRVRLALQLENSVVNLYQEEVDLAIRIGMPEDSGLKARKLLQNRMLVCASPEYLAEYGWPTVPADLADHNCLTLERGRQTVWWHFRQGEDYSKVAVSGNLTSAGGTPLREAARQGLGLAVLAHWMVAEDLAQGELVTVLPTWQVDLREGGSGDIYALFVPDLHLKPALRALIDYLCAALPARLTVPAPSQTPT